MNSSLTPVSLKDCPELKTKKDHILKNGTEIKLIKTNKHHENLLQLPIKFWKKTRLYNFKCIKHKIKNRALRSFYIRNIKKIINHYKNISITPNFNENYIIYYLHYEPEAATLPIAKNNSNQLLNIRIIRSSMPKNWVLYIKEHPAQIDTENFKTNSWNKYGKYFNKYRSIEFYDYINKINNVQFIHPDCCGEKLLQHAKIISSIHGTITLEASHLNKPCIIFSESNLYKMFNNTWLVQDTNDCKEAINKIIQSGEIKSNCMKILDKYTYLKNKDMSETISELFELICII